ncbi:MAG: hypothetical protein GX998_04935 [Firmicutes bacterium]|nr:hypothetical protein [Bacillota bacterium]
MLAGYAKDVARQWVIQEGVKTPGFCGAFLHGSINWLPDDALFPAHSDVDVMLVLEGSDLPNKFGKFFYQDVLLEVSFLPKAEMESPEMVLSQYHLAGSFQAADLLLDPGAELARLQAAVSRAYAKRKWVYRRCLHARDKILSARLDETVPLHDQVNAWLFPAGITTHVLLVAGLRNPTVRRRYVETHKLLADYGHLPFYESLLDLLGCTQMERARVAHHLEALTDVFDQAKTVIKTPFFFSSDISEVGRPIAIDGSWEMIESGYHREAIFWIAATYSRCQKVFLYDAPTEVYEWASRGYRQLLLDLGITCFADLKQRREQTKALLPRVLEVAEAIMDANPQIED